MNKPKQRKSINLLVADYETIRRYCFTKNVKMTPWITALALRAIARDKVFKAARKAYAVERSLIAKNAESRNNTDEGEV